MGNVSDPLYITEWYTLWESTQSWVSRINNNHIVILHQQQQQDAVYGELKGHSLELVWAYAYRMLQFINLNGEMYDNIQLTG